MKAETVDLKKELPCADFIKDYVDIPRFLGCCAACPGFGRTWACPPYDFDPMDIWRSYSTILLYAKKVLIPPEERERQRTEDELRADYEAILSPVKAGLLEELFAMEREREGSLALSAGGCSECESCTRPEGLPCRLPERKRYSVESLGGDVLKASEELLGERILWAENGSMPPYFIIMGALLIK